MMNNMPATEYWSERLLLLQNFINEAETMLNSSPTRNVGGSTPGVIGAQEVYR